MSGNQQKRLLCVPVSHQPRLPAGVTAEELCNTKGVWPKRELSHEELLDTYRAFFSSRFRAEALMLMDAFRKEYGDSVCEIIEKVYYEMGKAEGRAEKDVYGCLLNKMLDIYARPHSYVVEHLETTKERIEYRVLKCPLAEVVKDMGLEELGKHFCIPWHEGYAEAMGYRTKVSEFLLDGGDSCHWIWEKTP